METYTDTDDEISLPDVFALCVRKFFLVLVCALVGAAAAVGIHFISSNTEDDREAFESESAHYYQALDDLNIQRDTLIMKRDMKAAQNAENPIMTLDPQNTVRTFITFYIETAEDDIIVAENGNVISKTSTALTNYFRFLNLPDLLNVDYEDSYLRNLISLSVYPQNFRLTAYWSNEEFTQNAVKVIFGVLLDFINGGGFGKVSWEEPFTVVGLSTMISNAIESNNNAVTELNTEIIKLEDSIKDLKKDEPSRYHFKKFALIGFLAGGVLAVIILAVWFVCAAPVTGSFDAEQRLKVLFLGAVFTDNRFFDRLARRIIGERLWNTQKDAEQWISRNIDTVNGLTAGKRVVFACGFPVDKISGKSGSENGVSGNGVSGTGTGVSGSNVSGNNVPGVCKILGEIFEKKGLKTEFFENSYQNSLALEAIKKSDAVVLVEKQWKSKWSVVKADTDLIERLGGNLTGFILC